MSCPIEEIVKALNKLMSSKAVANDESQGSLLREISFAFSDLGKTLAIPDRKGTDGFTNHTGGAYGADNLWSLRLGAKGVKNKHYRPVGDTGNKITKHRAKVTDGTHEVIEVTPQEMEAGKYINASLGNSTHGMNNRNYTQVKNADAVYAVAPIVKGVVSGGTGSAVRIAQHLGKDVYVLNTTDQEWYMWNGKSYEKFEGIPPIANNFAAIGTRKIEKHSMPDKDANGDTIKDSEGKTVFKDSETFDKETTKKVVAKIDEFVNYHFGEKAESNIINDKKEVVDTNQKNAIIAEDNCKGSN